MSSKSLRLRLALVSAVTISLVLLLAGFALTALFERHVNRRVEAELDAYLRQLAAEVNFTVDGDFRLGNALSDPRFEQPFSGHYWQIEDDRAQSIKRSRSLWDHVIKLPRGDNDRAIHRYMLPGPAGSSLLVRELHISYPDDEKRGDVRIAVAQDRREALEARRAFANDIMWSLVILAALLMLASWLQITFGLRPLEALRRSVMAVRAGKHKMIEVDEPEEVMPLVDEVNSLLGAQVRAIERARMRAADLAHGLKTPLTVMGLDADRLRQKGEAALADEIEELAAGMRRHIGRELTRARLDSAARSRPPGKPIRPVLDGVMRTLVRTPKGANLRWTVDVPQSATAAMSEDDLAELLGNLLENAVKWATSEVSITAAPGPLNLTIEDDGGGVSSDLLDRLGQRGIRLDVSVEGSGLGLAIVRDILDAYGGGWSLGEREPHGFRVSVTLPP